MFDKRFLLGIMLLAFVASSVSAFCTVQGYYHNATGDRAYANSSIYCQGLAETKTFAPNYAYAVNFGGVGDNCLVCSPLIRTRATNATLGIRGSNSRTSGFSVNIVELNVTLVIPYPSSLTWVSQTPAQGSRTNSNAAYFNFTFVEDYPDTCKIQVNGVNHTCDVLAADYGYYHATSLPEGTQTAIGYLSNVEGNGANTVTRTYTTDYTPPAAVAWSTNMSANLTTLDQDYIYWNCTFTDAFPGSCNIDMNGTNYTGTILGQTCYRNSTGLTRGNTYRALCYVSDDVGNWNVTGTELRYDLKTSVAPTTPPGSGGGGGGGGATPTPFALLSPDKGGWTLKDFLLWLTTFALLVIAFFYFKNKYNKQRNGFGGKGKTTLSIKGALVIVSLSLFVALVVLAYMVWTFQ